MVHEVKSSLVYMGRHVMPHRERWRAKMMVYREHDTTRCDVLLCGMMRGTEILHHLIMQSTI